MNIIFNSLERLDDDLIEMTYEMIKKGKKRRSVFRAVRYTVIIAAAAAACLMLPFGIQKWSEWINLPVPAAGPNGTVTEAAVTTYQTSEATTTHADTAAYAVPENPCIKVFDYFYGELPEVRELEFSVPDYPESKLRWDFENITDISREIPVTLYSGMPIWSVYLADITGDGRYELCSTISVGSGVVDKRITVYDIERDTLYTLQDRGATDYVLAEKDGVLYVRAYAYAAFDSGSVEEPLGEIPLTLSMLTPVSDEPANAPPPEKIVDFVTADAVPMETSNEIFFEIEQFPDLDFKYTGAFVGSGRKDSYKLRTLFDADTVISVYLADINGDGAHEICSVIKNGGAESVVAYDVSADALSGYITPYSHIPHYELEIIENSLYMKSFLENGELFSEEKLEMSMLSPVTDNDWPENDESAGDTPENADEVLKNTLALKAQPALEISTALLFGGAPYSELIYELSEEGNSYYSEYAAMSDGWYFSTESGMRWYLNQFFTADAVEEYMDRVAEGEITGGKITRSKPASIISVDGDLYVLIAGKETPMPPAFDSAWVESANENEITFRADVMVEGDGTESYYAPGRYVYRGVIRNEDGEWKFAQMQPAVNCGLAE